MSLVLDNRATLAGKPGLHALIIGVSNYTHLAGGTGPLTQNSYGMQQLSSTALTSFKIYQWLLAHQNQMPLPLATVRLLLSPSQDELNVEPAMTGLGDSATRANVAAECHAWRTDAAASDDNMTLFYFSGHGVQRKKDDAVMLLADFGNPIEGPLTNALAIENLFNGMAPPSDPTRKIAQRQIYFIDACRIAPKEFNVFDWLNVPDIWAVERSGRDDRSAPIFFAAIPGTKAYARKAQQTVFCEALIKCLDSLGGEPMEEDAQGRVNWQVTSYSLAKVLTPEIDEFNRLLGCDQSYTPGGLFKDITINYLNAAPQVDVTVEIDPENAMPHVELKVTDFSGNVVMQQAPPLNPHPYTTPLPAGYYTFSAEPMPPPPALVRFSRLIKVMPPRLAWKARVS